MKENEIKKIIKNKNCRGCSNRCSLLSPGCNRSKVYIEDELKKFEDKSSGSDESWVNLKLF